ASIFIASELMSVLPPKADIAERGHHVRFVPSKLMNGAADAIACARAELLCLGGRAKADTLKDWCSGSDEVWPAASADASLSRKTIAQPQSPERCGSARPDTIPEGDPLPNDNVWGFISMADGNRLPPPPFTAFDAPDAGLLSFFKTLLNTARSWSDN